MVLQDELVRRSFIDNAVDGKISCSECFRIAQELGIPKDEIAHTLTELNIKIIRCQLGCFP